MLFLKLVLVVFATACVMVLFTVAWVVSKTGARGGTGIDVDIVYAITLHSPLYWLLAVAVLTAAVWLGRRWVFST